MPFWAVCNCLVCWYFCLASIVWIGLNAKVCFQATMYMDEYMCVPRKERRCPLNSVFSLSMYCTNMRCKNDERQLEPFVINFPNEDFHVSFNEQFFEFYRQTWRYSLQVLRICTQEMLIGLNWPEPYHWLWLNYSIASFQLIKAFELISKFRMLKNIYF